LRVGLALALAILSCLAFTGCDALRGRAVGGNDQVTVVTDLPPNDPAVRALEHALTPPILTVRPEPAFALTTVRGQDFRSIARDRNLVLLADDTQSGPTTVLIDELATRTRIQTRAAGVGADALAERLLLDPWARGQTVLVLAAPGTERLAAAISADEERIYRRFEDAVTAQTGVLLYAAGEERALRRELAVRFGWSLRLPRGYRAGTATAAGFARFFMREGGARLIYVHWQDGVRQLPSADSCLALRARLAARYYEGDFVDSTRSRAERVTFLGHDALRLSGLWQNDLYTMGGPFRTYCFMDGERLMMIDLAVFQPTGAKVGLLRQLEAIARTYRDERVSAPAGKG